MSEDVICPFSKPIIGQWCQCQYATLSERCSGKMICSRADDQRETCMKMVELLRQNSRFVLGLAEDEAGLTHTQLMKIRCGGLLGMQRVLDISSDQAPLVPDVINQVEYRFGGLNNFPYNQIMPDIKSFSHRNSKKRG